MKITYFTHAPSRVGQTILVRDLEEGEILRTKQWSSMWTYYKRENGFLWSARRKKNPEWRAEYTTETVDYYKHLLLYEGEIIV